MYELLIQNYINTLTMDDLRNLAVKYQVEINEHDLEIIYDTVKKRWKNFLKDSSDEEWKKLEEQINPTTYQLLKTLFQMAKAKYHF